MNTDFHDLNNGKSTETLRKNMVPGNKWKIRWNEKLNIYETLNEYEEIESSPFDFNLSSRNKGDLDYLNEKDIKYGDYYNHLKDKCGVESPAKINYTDNTNFHNDTTANKDVPNVVPPLNIDTVVDVDIPEK
jgi:hypothetical protein